MTDNRRGGWVERFGPRGAKLAILVSGFLYVVLIVGGASLILLDGWQGGHVWRSLFIGALAVVALLIWLRIVMTNWRAIDSRFDPRDIPPVAPDGTGEDTGIWGVGGPAMREPGSTGIARTLRSPRGEQDD